MTKTFGIYSQFMDCPNSLKLHKTVICTEDEAYDEISNFESQRFNNINQHGPCGRLVEFIEEIA